MQNPESTLLHLRLFCMRHVVAGSHLPVVYGCKYLVDVRVDALLVVVIDERLLGGIEHGAHRASSVGFGMRAHGLSRCHSHGVNERGLTRITAQITESLNGVSGAHVHDYLASESVVCYKFVSRTQHQIMFGGSNAARLSRLSSESHESRQYAVALRSLHVGCHFQQVTERFLCVLPYEDAVRLGHRSVAHPCHFLIQALRPHRYGCRFRLSHGGDSCLLGSFSGAYVQDGLHLLLDAGLSCSRFRYAVVNVGHVHEDVACRLSQLRHLQVHGYVCCVGRLGYASQLFHYVQLHVRLEAAVECLRQSFTYHVGVFSSGLLLTEVHDVVNEAQTGSLLSCVVGVTHAADHLHTHLGVVGERVQNVNGGLASRQCYLSYCLVGKLLYLLTACLRIH